MMLSEDSLRRARVAVLLIDVEAALCVDVRRQLAMHYRLLEAADAAAGSGLARRHEPELVIRGTSVPGLEGYVPCREHVAGVQVGSPEDERFLERLEQVIAENLGDDEFDTAVLVRRLATSRTKLYQRLSHLLGRSPAELIQERRLERAAARFAEGTDSVSEVAFGVGFKSVSHFSRRFKDRYGIRPSALIRRGREAGRPAPDPILEAAGRR